MGFGPLNEGTNILKGSALITLWPKTSDKAKKIILI
jgi:hypothetical protein